MPDGHGYFPPKADIVVFPAERQSPAQIRARCIVNLRNRRGLRGFAALPGERRRNGVVWLNLQMAHELSVAQMAHGAEINDRVRPRAA